MLRDVAKGQDPASAKKAARKAETFRELAEEYMRRHAKQRKRSWKKDRQALDRDLLPRLGHRKAASITRREVISILDDIKDRGAPIQANRTLEIIRKIFNWGISREIVEANPCHRIEKPAEEHQRDRVLSEDEIRAVWGAFDPEPNNRGAMMKLRLLTAQRGGEVSHMRWCDIDLAGGWWTVPPEYSKNGLSHRVPLAPPAVTILKDLHKQTSGGPWVFPSPIGKGPTKSNSKASGRLRESSGVDFVPHDLRRTAASHMTGMGISRLVVAKILNHVETGVTKVYDRHSYDAEKRHALKVWAARVEEIVAGEPAADETDKVVKLR